jgi:hypothetical protein
VALTRSARPRPVQSNSAGSVKKGRKVFARRGRNILATRELRRGGASHRERVANVWTRDEEVLVLGAKIGERRSRTGEEWEMLMDRHGEEEARGWSQQAGMEGCALL